MAIVFKRKGDTPPTPAPQATPPAATPGKPKPIFRAPVLPPKTVDQPAPVTRAPVQSIAPKPMPKVLKLGNAKEASKPAEAPEAPVSSVKPDKLTTGLSMAPRYPQVHVGERVEITSSQFPWVKHYKVGDKGFVKHIMGNKDPLGITHDGTHQMHIIEIDEPIDKDRKGQSAGLFRWEFSRPQDIGIIPSGKPPAGALTHPI